LAAGSRTLRADLQFFFACPSVVAQFHNKIPAKLTSQEDSIDHVRWLRLAIEFVDYGNVRIDFDGAPIEKCGFVTPLAHGIESRWIKHGVAFEGLQRADCAIGADEGVELDAAFATGLAG
jgi:hypothetical protein